MTDEKKYSATDMVFLCKAAYEDRATVYLDESMLVKVHKMYSALIELELFNSFVVNISRLSSDDFEKIIPKLKSVESWSLKIWMIWTYFLKSFISQIMSQNKIAHLDTSIIMTLHLMNVSILYSHVHWNAFKAKKKTLLETILWETVLFPMKKI